ncbi:MAG: CcoQ/FixQ family Cbb3-type cytochrome c oxidase assembly chaperone [Saprospiraceae bacterium]|nr:CcoQ/FixQ family Cbb3-type cytochrome c oxidase assembly chaperone [Saprospiraceae bacterium]
MKFINYLQSITGISIFPLIALIIFTVFFTAMLIYVFAMDKNTVARISHIPLEDNLPSSSFNDPLL